MWAGKRNMSRSRYHSAKPDGESLLPIWWLPRRPMNQTIDISEQRPHTTIRCITGMFRVKPPTKLLNNRPRRRLSIRKTSANPGRSTTSSNNRSDKDEGKGGWLLTGYTTPPTYCFSHLATSMGLGRSIRNYWGLSLSFLEGCHFLVDC